MRLTLPVLIHVLICTALAVGQANDHHLVIRTLLAEKVRWRDVAAGLDAQTSGKIEDTLRKQYLEPDWPYPQFDIVTAFAGSEQDVVVFLTTEYDLGHTVRVFALTNGELRLLAEYDGYVSAIDRGVSGSIHEFMITKPPGGDGLFYEASLRSFRSGSKGIAIDSISSYSWHMETSVAKGLRVETYQEFVIGAQEYNLRSKPLVDRYQFDEQYYSNATSFATYGMGDRGIGIATQTDDTCREWRLVIMDSRSRKVRNGINAGHLVGWMSAKYLGPVSMPNQSGPTEK